MDSLLFAIPFFIYAAHRMCEADPCLTHQNISDVDLLTDHKYVSGQACDFTPAAFPPAWYRYTATPSGAIATSCPDENACGAKEQLWVNDSSTTALATVVTTPTTSTSSTAYSSPTATKRVVTSSTNVTYTLLKTTFTTASKTILIPSGESTIIPVVMSSKFVSTLSSSTSISNNKKTTSALRLQPIERGNDSADKNISNSLSAGLGATGALILVAVVTTASVYINVQKAKM